MPGCKLRATEQGIVETGDQLPGVPDDFCSEVTNPLPDYVTNPEQHQFLQYLKREGTPNKDM